MSSQALDIDSTVPLPPHPTLREYYDDGPYAKRAFLRDIFDDGAADYERVERAVSFGTGPWYRFQALRRAGLTRGMRVLDVAIGTGLVARQAAKIVGDSRHVVGIDPSAGMLARARETLNVAILQGVGERLPLADASFDFISMGYALRHLPDLNPALSEFFRVLKPGGRLCILEITKPRGRFAHAATKWYMRRIVPIIAKFVSKSEHAIESRRLWEYYWETIEQCVPAEVVLPAMERAGFVNVSRYTELGIFTEYTGSRLSS